MGKWVRRIVGGTLAVVVGVTVLGLLVFSVIGFVYMLSVQF